MPSTFSDLDRRTQLIVSGVTALVVIVVAVVGGFGIHGALPRPYAQVSGEEVVPAANTGLGRAVSAMKDLRYLCTEGKPAREGVRGMVCSGPEGWAEIESLANGKVTYLTLVGRAGEMTDDRAAAVGRALVNGADLSQDAKIAARSVTDGRAELSSGPWGSVSSGEGPYRLVFVGSDRPKLEKPAALGPAAALETRLGKSCESGASASPSPSATPSATPTVAATPVPVPVVTPHPVGPTGPLTTCTSSSRFVTTTTSYNKVGSEVTHLTVRSSAIFAYGWTHTEAISALRLALKDLGQDSTGIGDWVAANATKQGTIDLGQVMVELNTEGTRSVTSITVSRVA